MASTSKEKKPLESGHKQDMEYNLDGRGLIVTVRQRTHNVIYRKTWSEKDTLNYDVDEQRLLTLFDPNKLQMAGKGKSRHGKKKSIAKRVAKKLSALKPKQFEEEETYKNILLQGLNLTNQKDGERSFDTFMNKVGSYRDQDPKFVMFFLMSHGFPNGEFLLAANGVKGSNGSTTPEGPCCGATRSNSTHKLAGECHGRHIVKDIIAPLSASYPNIPKIFIIQVCRGGRSAVVQTDQADPSLPINCQYKEREGACPDIELFIPEFPDTLVFRACIEGHGSYVLYKDDIPDELPEGGSLLVQHFCQSLEQLITTHQEYNKLLKSTKQKQVGSLTDTSDVISNLEKCRESVTGGWMMNVCQRTTALVTNYMFSYVHLPKVPLCKMLQASDRQLNILLADAQVDRTYEEFVNSLEQFKEQSQHRDEISQILQVIRHGTTKKKWKKRAIAMLIYLWENVRKSPSTYEPLRKGTIANENKLIVTNTLNGIIDEVKSQSEYDADDKQQPHISSSLSNKVSCIKLMQLAREHTTTK